VEVKTICGLLKPRYREEGSEPCASNCGNTDELFDYQYSNTGFLTKQVEVKTICGIAETTL
jgi:hypothetical protein